MAEPLPLLEEQLSQRQKDVLERVDRAINHCPVPPVAACAFIALLHMGEIFTNPQDRRVDARKECSARYHHLIRRHFFPNPTLNDDGSVESLGNYDKAAESIKTKQRLEIPYEIVQWEVYFFCQFRSAGDPLVKCGHACVKQERLLTHIFIVHFKKDPTVTDDQKRQWSDMSFPFFVPTISDSIEWERHLDSKPRHGKPSPDLLYWRDIHPIRELVREKAEAVLAIFPNPNTPRSLVQAPSAPPILPLPFNEPGLPLTSLVMVGAGAPASPPTFGPLLLPATGLNPSPNTHMSFNPGPPPPPSLHDSRYRRSTRGAGAVSRRRQVGGLNGSINANLNRTTMPQPASMHDEHPFNALAHAPSPVLNLMQPPSVPQHAFGVAGPSASTPQASMSAMDYASHSMSLPQAHQNLDDVDAWVNMLKEKEKEEEEEEERIQEKQSGRAKKEKNMRPIASTPYVRAGARGLRSRARSSSVASNSSISTVASADTLNSSASGYASSSSLMSNTSLLSSSSSSFVPAPLQTSFSGQGGDNTPYVDQSNFSLRLPGAMSLEELQGLSLHQDGVPEGWRTPFSPPTF